MSTSRLSKPEFKSCDETSLTLSLNLSTIALLNDGNVLKLQYKLPHETWQEAKIIPIGADCTVKSSSINVEDLNPGTPYCIRLGLFNGDVLAESGPEIVFDTSPVDCTPKRKCIVS